MIKLKHILSELLLQESLPPSLAKKYTSIKQNPKILQRLNSIFTALANLPNATTSKRGDRVYFPFSKEGGMVTQESPVKKEVEQSLQGTDFKLKDYKSAIAVDKFGRDVKLGKVLTKLGKEDLLNKVNGDKTREGATQTDFIMVFSRHPYDIAGMSTDRGWTSCMNLYGGEYKQYVSKDIKEGTFICYITKPEDTNLNNPVGRVLVKPFINVEDKSDVLYAPEENTYGTVPSNFPSTVGDVIGDIQGQKVGMFELVKSLYCDTAGTIVRHPKTVQDILDGKSKPKTKAEVQQILDFLDIRVATINSDLTVDVKGHVNISYNNLIVIPVQFRNVSGYFNCTYNNLTSLEGAPKEVGGHFYCIHNKLTSLKGAPQKVGGDFNCEDNNLTSLEGAPQKVGGDFTCNGNRLTSLEGCPQKVGGHFRCNGNKLTSLKGAPQKVGGDFNCTYNNLTSLEGAPKEVGGDFSCSVNRLTSLEGGPQKVGGNFYCIHNKLTSLKGAPQKVGGDFNCEDNNLTSLEGAPQKVGGYFACNGNRLTSLEGAPKEVDRYFYCDDNPKLPQSEKEWAEKNIKAKSFHW